MEKVKKKSLLLMEISSKVHNLLKSLLCKIESFILSQYFLYFHVIHISLGVFFLISLLFLYTSSINRDILITFVSHSKKKID